VGRRSVPAPGAIDWRRAIEDAKAVHRQGRLDEAEALYRQLLRLLPGHPDLTHFHGLLLFQRHRSDEALALVRRSIELQPKVAAWHNNLGNMLLDKQQPAEAAEAYQRCLALDPDNREVRNNLGCLLRAAGRLDEAETVLREAIARAPDACNAHANLALVLAGQGRADEAMGASARALELEPENFRSRRVLGVFYAQRGRRDLAERIFRNWLERRPGDAEALHHLAAITGEQVPERAADGYVAAVFDRFAASFDAKLAQLDYRAPSLCAELLQRRAGAPDGRREVLDAGCGTGLCGPALRGYARTLTGVDLSAGMLAKARQRGVYDRLEQAELSAWLAQAGTQFDLIVSADTLCYFGTLQPLLADARAAARPAGWLVFTVEALDEAVPEGSRLLHHGRYAHHRDAIERWLRAAGWQQPALEAVVLRQEAGQPVSGWLVSACAPPTAAAYLPAGILPSTPLT
jgi:predicted TPR repeat methyltransferase